MAYVSHFTKLKLKWDIISKMSSYSMDILLHMLIGYAYWNKMSRFSIKCVQCRVVAPSCCWGISHITSHLFVSPSSISMRYYQRIVIDEEFSNLKMELYFWNRLTKYHYGLIVCIQCYCYNIYIKYHINARHKWDITFRQLNTDGKMCLIFNVWNTRKQFQETICKMKNNKNMMKKI